MHHAKRFENAHLHASICQHQKQRPVRREVTRSFLEQEIKGSNFGPVKSDTVLPTARRRCDISSKGNVLPGQPQPKKSDKLLLQCNAHL